MINELQKQMEPVLDAHKGTTGLYLSGGSDSLFLLRLLLDMKASFHVISFDYSFSRTQRKVVDDLIIKHGLRVFSYAPSSLYFIGDGKEISLVEEYALPDGSMFPFLRDCTQDDSKCIYDEAFYDVPQSGAPIAFTLNIFGTRKFDRHYSLGRLGPKKLSQRGDLTFYRPLWDLTRRDVRAGLKSFGERFPKVDTGNYELCTLCMSADKPVMCPRKMQLVAPFSWNPLEMLGAFRQKFGVYR